MGKDRGPHLNVTDLAVRIEAGVPSISTVVRRARLKLVARVGAADCDALKALTQDPHIVAGEFFGEVKRDLVCLHDFDRRLSSLPSPETGLDQWSRFWRTAGRYWKRYVSVLKSPADVKGVSGVARPFAQMRLSRFMDTGCMVCLGARDSLLSLMAYVPFASVVFRRGYVQWITFLIAVALAAMPWNTLT